MWFFISNKNTLKKMQSKFAPLSDQVDTASVPGSLTAGWMGMEEREQRKTSKAEAVFFKENLCTYSDQFKSEMHFKRFVQMKVFGWKVGRWQCRSRHSSSLRSLHCYFLRQQQDQTWPNHLCFSEGSFVFPCNAEMAVRSSETVLRRLLWWKWPCLV